MTDTVGQRVKAMRKALGLKQDQVADAVGVRRSQVSQWENDHQTPGGANLVRLARALNTTPERIIGEHETDETGREPGAGYRVGESRAMPHLDMIQRVAEWRRFEGVPGIGTQVGLVLSYAESEEWNRDELFEALQRIQGWAEKAEVELNDLRAEIRRRDRERDEGSGS